MQKAPESLMATVKGTTLYVSLASPTTDATCDRNTLALLTHWPLFTHHEQSQVSA